MKLLKTIKRMIEESEQQYEEACANYAPLEEIDRLEKHYYDSLKLLKLYEKSEERKLKPSSTHTDSGVRK